MSLRIKIMAGYGLVILIFMLSAGIGYYNISRIQLSVSNVPHDVKRDNQLNQVLYNVAMQTATIRGFLYYKQDSFIEQYKKYAGDNNTIIRDMIDTAENADNKERYFKMKDTQDKFTALMLEKLIPLAKEGKETEADQLARTEGVPLTSSLNKFVAELSDERELLLDNGVKTIVEDITATKQVTLIAAILALVLGILMGFLLASNIARPIKHVADEAAKIADGDLTGREIPAKTKDEVGQLAGAFNTMLTNLKEIANQLQEKSKIIALSSSELSVSAESVAAGATETASTVSQVAGSVEQITANVQHIANTSAQAAGYAGEGNEGIQRIAAQMEGIQNATAATAEVIYRSNESATKISQIVELITQIANQTNLLALNAAIEAARAGEQGRGFAVVAEEVRKLAEQSAGAAKEIYTLINNIQQESQKAVQSMDEGVDQVQIGLGVVKDVSGTFENIIASVQGFAVEIQTVTSAIEEISTAVQNVAAAAEEQTAIIEEISSTTQDLTRMAGEIEGFSMRFKLS